MHFILYAMTPLYDVADSDEVRNAATTLLQVKRK